jgi:hypothetical protein
MSGTPMSNEHATSSPFGWAFAPRTAAVNLAADLAALSDWPDPLLRVGTWALAPVIAD